MSETANWIDIADKLLTLGFGILLGGAVGAVTAWMNNASQAKKALNERRRQILEGVTDVVDSFCSDGAKYHSTLRNALVVGAKAGLDPDAMVDVINAGSGKTGASMDKIPKHVLTRSFDFGFAIGLSAKDVRLCLEEAVDLGVPMQVGRAVVDFVQNVKDRFGDQADLTELIRAIEQDAGVEVRGKNAKV